MAKIDFEQTTKNCRYLKRSALASDLGVTPPLITAVMKGKYKTMSSPSAVRVLDKLRELHLLAEVPDDGDVDLAA